MKRLFKNSVIVILLIGTSIYFTSCKKEATLPIVTTTNVSEIRSTSAATGGIITSDGGSEVTAQGVCWNTAPFPTLGNNKTNNGTGSGTFSSNMTGLTPNTTYYVRAYATNRAGTAYGNEVSFKSNEISLATLTTIINSFTSTTAEFSGNITDDGGDPVTVRGVCWGTAPDPTISINKTSDESGTGSSFTNVLTDLAPNTTYYVRAYATNSAGTAYGNQVSFITKQIEVATLITTAVSSITSTTAVLGGNIADDGGDPVTVRGICWGTAPGPTININNTSDESGTGSSFTSKLTNLAPNTTYYVRAYATNSAGTAYGNEVTFSTPLRDPAGQKADYPGGALYGAAGFSIGTKVYIGLGYDSGDFPVRDFWERDQATNVWIRKADYPGNSTGLVVCFSIGTKGYIGTGNSFNTYGFTNEFWEYDPATDSWSRKASLPTTTARGLAVGFSIGNKGYIGLGNKDPDGNSNLGYYQDFWEWDQATDVWTKKADFEGNARSGAVGFSIGNKGYIGTGSDGVSNSKEFWEWDQATNVWTKKVDFPGNARIFAISFSIGNKGYIGTGNDGTSNCKDFWEWDQATNVWTRKADFEGNARSGAVGFSIGNKGYIGMGWDSTSNLKDFWEYDPNFP